MKGRYLLRTVPSRPAAFMSPPADQASETTHSPAPFMQQSNSFGLLTFLSVCTKLWSQNMFKCLRRAVGLLCNLVWLLEARKRIFCLYITLSLLAIWEIIQQSPRGTGSRLKAKSSLASLLLLPGRPRLRTSCKSKNPGLMSFWDFSFLVCFFQLVYKIIAINYRILKNYCLLWSSTSSEYLCHISFLHSSFICL